MVPSALLIVVALALVVANAFFVASEFALVKIRSTRLEQLAARGNRRAAIALGISHHIDAYLSANQLGITLASLALGWIGEPAFAGLLEPPLARLGLSHDVIEGIALTASFVVITGLHVVVGELAPKSLAIQRTEPVALWTAAPLRAFYLAAFPVIWLMNAAAGVALRLVGLRPASEAEAAHTPEELRLLLRRIPFDPEIRRFIDRVFDYTHRVARHVMILRRDVVTLHADRSFDENVARALVNQYTRYPLVVEATDEVVGYVHLKDLVIAMAQGRKPDLRHIARSPVFATEETALENIRKAFQRQRVHLAIIRDARGGFSGIVTLEDLLEEVVGEIQDEQDAGEVPPIARLPDGRFEVDGRVTLDVAEREIGLPASEAPPGAETIGGWVTALLGEAPRRAASVQVPGFRLTVLAVREQRVARLRVDVEAPPEPAPGVE